MAAYKLTSEQESSLLEILQKRFEKNTDRHPNTKWDDVLRLLQKNSSALWSLEQMEVTEGEPDVVDFGTKEIIFVDCSAESPKRRSLCYDREAWEKRKENKPQNTAKDIADEMGVAILTEEQYRKLQELGKFDLKTSSWIETPEKIRKLGGALFCDRRYDTVFTYHNGADSYYAARGFRALIKIKKN